MISQMTRGWGIEDIVEIEKNPLFTDILSRLTKSLKSLIKCSDRECYLKFENIKKKKLIYLLKQKNMNVS